MIPADVPAVSHEHALIVVAIIGIIVPLCTTILGFVQTLVLNRRHASHAAIIADHMQQDDATTRRMDQKLDQIHIMVNNQLSEAVNRLSAALEEIQALKAAARPSSVTDQA